MLRSLFGVALLPALVLGCNPSDPGTDMGQTAPLVRMAHYVDGLAAIDVCLKGSNDSDFTTPLVKTKLMRNGGVPYAYTSGYMSVAADSYTVRFIAGSTEDCANPIFGSAYDVPIDAPKPGHRYTVVGMGNLGRLETLRVQLIEDDNSIDANQARVRFIHAVSTNPASLDFGSGSGANFSALLTADSYSSVSVVNGQPYLAMAPVTTSTFSARPTGTSTDLKTMLNEVTFEKGKVYTATMTTYIGASTDYELSLCPDTDDPVQGLLPCKELR